MVGDHAGIPGVAGGVLLFVIFLVLWSLRSFGDWGIYFFTTYVEGKRLELMKRVYPEVHGWRWGLF